MKDANDAAPVTAARLACRRRYRARAPEYFDGVIEGAAGGGWQRRAATRARASSRADLFAWRPDRRYDAVFFGFWLSHVPLERFGAFWAVVDECLAPDGRVFFADDGYRTPDELIEGESSSTILRRLTDGTPHRAVKVPHEPADLERRLARLGWRIAVTQTSGPFYWGAGGRQSSAGDRTAGQGLEP
jgi:hypothetical protein